MKAVFPSTKREGYDCTSHKALRIKDRQGLPAQSQHVLLGIATSSRVLSKRALPSLNISAKLS
jgi:hypothetical protein